jgi:glycosyltransferase involved in cell wall biosynthesis
MAMMNTSESPVIPARHEATESFWRAAPPRRSEIAVGLLTGGIDRHYMFGLTMALISQGMRVDVVGSDGVDSAEMHATSGLNFLSLQRNNSPGTSKGTRIQRLLAYYARLIGYSCGARPKIFHILWNNKLKHLDRTLLMVCYRLLGKKVVLTAHNVNMAQRDGKDSRLNRLTLKIQYRLSDHIFVHTKKMKDELAEQFGVRADAVTVIPYGINNAVPNTAITSPKAKERLGIKTSERTILFYGNIRSSKGLHHLVTAFHLLAHKHPEYRLIIAGEPKKGCEQYVRDVQDIINAHSSRDRVIQRIGYVPDSETELCFKAADVLALPYDHIFQSGVLFVGYAYGLPVIASDVGSLREDVLEGKTGFLCKPCDPIDLAATIEKYFDSNLFKDLESHRQKIRAYACRTHSWDVVGEMTRAAYLNLLGSSRSYVPILPDKEDTYAVPGAE